MVDIVGVGETHRISELHSFRFLDQHKQPITAGSTQGGADSVKVNFVDSTKPNLTVDLQVNNVEDQATLFINNDGKQETHTFKYEKNAGAHGLWKSLNPPATHSGLVQLVAIPWERQNQDGYAQKIEVKIDKNLTLTLGDDLGKNELNDKRPIGYADFAVKMTDQKAGVTTHINAIQPELFNVDPKQNKGRFLAAVDNEGALSVQVSTRSANQTFVPVSSHDKQSVEALWDALEKKKDAQAVAGLLRARTPESRRALTSIFEKIYEKQLHNPASNSSESLGSKLFKNFEGEPRVQALTALFGDDQTIKVALQVNKELEKPGFWQDEPATLRALADLSPAQREIARQICNYSYDLKKRLLSQADFQIHRRWIDQLLPGIG